MNKKLLRGKRRMSAAISVFFVICAIFLSWTNNTYASDASEGIMRRAFDKWGELAKEHIDAERAAAHEKPPDKISVTLAFAGDCTLGSDLKYGKAGSFVEVFERQSEPFDYFFANVEKIFSESDLSIVNLEVPLTSKGVKVDKEFAFLGDPSYVEILKRGDIDAVNLANNHTRDYGVDGYNDTIKNLDAAGVGSFGEYKPYISEINGVKIGFLGYGAWGAGSSLKNRVAADIKALKDSGANAVVATFHGGTEGSYYPNDIQKTLFRHAADSGADLVVGHHPHVVQGIELYNGVPLVYSLGNFSFGGNRNPSDKDTFVFRQTYEFDPVTFEITGERSEVAPCSVSSVKNKNDFRPTLLSDSDAANILQKLKKISLPLNNGVDIFKTVYVYKVN